MHLAKCAAASGSSGSMPGCCILLQVKGLANCTLYVEMGMGMQNPENLGCGTVTASSGWEEEPL